MKFSKPIIILAALIIISLGLAGSGFYLFQKEQIKNTQLQAELEDVKAKHRLAESKYEQARKEALELQSRVDAANAQVDGLAAQLEEQRRSHEERIGQLNQELDAQKKMKADLEAALKQAQEDLNKSKADLSTIRSEKESLEARLKEIGAPPFGGVELGKIVVGPEGATEASATEAPPAAQQPPEPQPAQQEASSAGKEGKVLVVNKDYNFAVINLGSRDGINLGDVFSIFHADNYIGDVKVEKLHDSMAAAGFLSSETKDKISEGDKVLQKNK